MVVCLYEGADDMQKRILRMNDYNQKMEEKPGISALLVTVFFLISCGFMVLFGKVTELLISLMR